MAAAFIHGAGVLSVRRPGNGANVEARVRVAPLVCARRGRRVVSFMSGPREEELGMLIPEATAEEMKQLLKAANREELMVVVRAIATRTKRHLKRQMTHTSDYHASLARESSAPVVAKQGPTAADKKTPVPSKPPSSPPPKPSSLPEEKPSTSAPAAVSRGPPSTASVKSSASSQPPFTAASSDPNLVDPDAQLQKKIDQVEATARALRYQSSNQAANAYVDSLNATAPPPKPSIGAKTTIEKSAKAHTLRAMQDEFRRFWREKDILDSAHVTRLNGILSKHTQAGE